MSRKREELPKVEDGELVDYLDEDPEIPNQRYCIVSFLSPEKVLLQKQQFFYKKFIEWLDYDWKMKGQEHFLAFLSKKYNLKVEDVLKDHAEFERVHKEEVKKTDIFDVYQTFLLKNEQTLQEQFDSEVKFQTNVRGVKIRRSFATVEEAQQFAQVLRRKYPKDNLFIGKVGAWLPWDPSEHLMPEVDYAEKELNEIMRRYKENEVNKEIFFAEEREAAIQKQKEENKRRKEQAASGSVPTIMDAPAVHPSEGAIRE
jgi:hypothetical protein